MANETVVIDVIAKFEDKVTDAAKKAKKSVRDFEDSIDKLEKKKRSVRFDADTKRAESGIRNLMNKANTFGRKHFKGVFSVIDYASPKLNKTISKAKSFASKAWKGTLNFIDKASPIVEKAYNKARSFGNKVWKSTLSVVDKFTSPLTKLKNMLFNVNTLIATVATGLATKLVVADPVSYADDITTSTISFQTMLGSEKKGTKMMDDIMSFAKDTPFDTMGVVNGVQQMMAYGIEAENTLKYMEKIGNVMSAMGKGEEGIDSVTRALGQMRSTGRVNAQDMMQLTSVGIKAWDYLAKGMGKSVAEVREMSEDGAIDAETAIKHIMNGLDEFDGMMDKMSNRTVKGLWSNIKDTFQQSIVLKWGEGLQSGAIKGLSKFKDWLDRIDPLLEKAGTSLSKLGEALSTKTFDFLNGVAGRFEEAVSTDEFANADLGGKIKIVWDKVIWEPFSTWWENEGKPKVAKKMESFGESLGTGISNGLLTLLGFDAEGALNDGASIGASFADGFAEGFDGEAVGEALWKAFKKGFSGGSKGLVDLLLPGDQGATGGQKLMGAGLAYAGLKFGPTLFKGGKGLFKFGKGTADTVSVLKGTKAAADVGTGSATAAKILGKIGGGVSRAKSGASLLLSKAGTALKPYAITGAGLLKGGLSSIGTALGASGGSAAAIGGGSLLGGLLGGAGLVSGGIDIFKGFKSDNKKDKKTKFLSGGSKIGMVGSGAAAGAAIGSLFGGVGAAPGALIGAGIGGVGALFSGSKLGKWLSDATDEGGSLNNIGKAIGDFFTESIPSALKSVGEGITVFFTETLPEKWDEFWTGVGDFFTEKIPYAIGFVAGKISTFFTETLPEKWDEFWTAVSDFFTETIPAAWETVSSKVSEFFTETLPEKWDEFWSAVSGFFTETLPTWAETVWNNNIVPFFTEDIPTFFGNLWSSISTFFTETIPTWASDVWNNDIVPFFTEDIPGFFSDIWDGVTTFFTESIPTIASDIWGSIKGWFSNVKDWFGSVWENVKGSFSAGYGAGSGSGTANNAAGGFIKSRTLSWLGEEGTPEVVIPLGSHRRNRAKALWERTGELLGIEPEYNARGGIVGADISETIEGGKAPLASFRHSGGNIEIHIGNITFEINAGGNPTDILAAIKAQKDAIVNLISETLYEALVAQFTNTPMAVG